MGLGGFEVATADGGRAELPTPGGASREITLENRLEFADMAEAFKMREFWAPVRIAAWVACIVFHMLAGSNLLGTELSLGLLPPSAITRAQCGAGSFVALRVFGSNSVCGTPDNLPRRFIIFSVYRNAVFPRWRPFAAAWVP